jgi:hypothetical protein
VAVSHFYPRLIFSSKAGAYPYGRVGASLHKIRIFITTVKSLLAQAQGKLKDNSTKLVFFTLTLRLIFAANNIAAMSNFNLSVTLLRNKLEHYTSRAFSE